MVKLNSEDYRLRDIIYDNENNCYYIYTETKPKLIPMCYN